MNEDLTNDERRLMARIELADKWDYLLHDLSILIPTLVIVGFGIHFDSPAAIISGLVVYGGVRLISSVRQVNMLTVMKSLIRKLQKQKESLQPVSACDSSPRADTGRGPQEK